MKDIKVLGIDLAKDVFQLHGVNALGKHILKKRIERDKLAAYIAKEVIVWTFPLTRLHNEP